MGGAGGQLPPQLLYPQIITIYEKVSFNDHFPGYLLNKRFYFKCVDNFIGHRENLEIELTFKQNFKQKVYLVAIDKVLTVFRDRLTNHSNLLDLLVCFEPDVLGRFSQ